MVIPGITKKMLGNLKKKDSEIVRNHLKKVKVSIRKKKDFLEGNLEELGEEIENPRDEIEQISKIIKDSEESVDAQLLSELLALEVDARELVTTIEYENNLLDKLITGSEKTDFEDVKKEIEGEVILGRLIEHQLNVLDGIHRINVSIINRVSDKKGSIYKEIGENINNLDKITSVLTRIILEDELPNLKVAYNSLRFEEWPELSKRIEEVRTSLTMMEPKLL